MHWKITYGKSTSIILFGHKKGCTHFYLETVLINSWNTEKKLKLIDGFWYKTQK